MALNPPVVLTIAGFDPSAGAGITADTKTIAAHSCYGVACITALTVQSTAGVKRVEPVDPGLVRETLTDLASDFEIAAIHIGMLGTAGVAGAVADFLKSSGLKNVVVDPVLRSSSGTDLLDAAGIKVLLERILPLSTVITPNIFEAKVLTGVEVTGKPDMIAAAQKLHKLGGPAVVVTGGHLDKAVDLLSFDGGKSQESFTSQRQESKSTHGTGCAFSTALACHLALGRGLPEAVMLAKIYVSAAISHGQPIGRGIGPVNHLYRMGQARRVGQRDPEPVGH
jgi:hydroxymethylpyrimidine/phosphomethylpyrimidine kinase